MVRKALLVRMEARQGKEEEAATFLTSALPLVTEESKTIAWFGIRIGTSGFGIFDAFPNEEARLTHLHGKVAAALMARAPELFTGAPVIEHVEILAAKLP
jgi:quinol monooxygenase YgiN